MQKQAPSIGRILVAVGFTLSCFGLLLFLWVTFGGPIPFKPESYRFTADFPEAITLQKEADVRIGGVSVGKVKSLSLAPESECHTDPATCNTTRATLTGGASSSGSASATNPKNASLAAIRPLWRSITTAGYGMWAAITRSSAVMTGASSGSSSAVCG